MHSVSRHQRDILPFHRQSARALSDEPDLRLRGMSLLPHRTASMHREQLQRYDRLSRDSLIKSNFGHAPPSWQAVFPRTMDRPEHWLDGGDRGGGWRNPRPKEQSNWLTTFPVRSESRSSVRSIDQIP